jgi:ABC-type transport system involved in multi-copper enzyme maturation permease subunit
MGRMSRWRPPRELRGPIGSAFLLFVVLEALLVVAVIWWPAFEENSAALKPFAGPIPKLLDTFNLIERLGVTGYVLGQHFFKACNTLGSAAAVLIGMGAIAGEAQRGTLEVWLARPVPRWRLYTERYLLGQLTLWVPVLASTATTNLLLGTIDERMNLGALMVCAVHQSLFLGAIFSLTFLFSALSSQPLRIAFVMLFLSIFQFAIYMVKTISDYSIYRLADIQTYATMMRYGMQPGPTSLLLLANVLPFALGLAAFKRRVP